jgi:hypothetical protein
MDEGPPRPGRENDRIATTAAAFRAGAQIYRALGTPLYGALCEDGANDPDIIALASHGQDGAQPVHLFACVHYLLLRDPGDPLSRFFATLAGKAAAPQAAFPDFARYCRQHRDEILVLLERRTVQTTYVDRCRALMPALCIVAEETGEPLNLIEIGCSAGLLLAFDRYAYDVNGSYRLGPADASVVLATDVRGGPPLRIPRIGRRIGIDLHPVDVTSEDERRWVIALSFPEFRDQQTRLAAALDVVARTDIRTLKGDGLALLPKALAETPDPVCIFHSTCLFYWSQPARAALDALLVETSRSRHIYRIGIEPSEHFDAWYAGRAGAPKEAQAIAQGAWGDVTMARYRQGCVDTRIVAHTAWDGGAFEWIE